MQGTFLRICLLWSLLALAGSRPAVAQDPNLFPTVTIYATDGRASEAGSDPATFTVRRSGPTNFPLAVFCPLSGTASNGVDYEQLGSSVQIPAGALDASFVVKPIDDSVFEGHETVVAAITGSPLDCATCGYNIGEPSNTVVIILDDDGPLATNHPPSVGIISPRNGDVFPASADIQIAASVFDPDGFFGTVEFFEGTNNLKIPMVAVTTSLFMITWSNVPAGFYELTAKATDEKGAMGQSSVLHVLVVETNAVPLPVVNIYAIDDTGREIARLPPWLYLAEFFDSALFTVTRTGPTDSPLTIFYRV